MAHDLLAVNISSHDQGGASLRGVIQLHVEIDRARAARRFLVSIMSALGVPVWLSAAAPQFLPSLVRSFSMAAWATCFLCLFPMVLREWRLRKRQSLL